MDLSVLGSHPYACGNSRGISYEPTVGIVIGGSGLAGDFTLETVFSPQPCSRTVIYHTFHKIHHEVGSLLADGLLAAVGELAEHIAHIVLDPRHELRGDIHALGRECVVCGNHLVQ